MRRLVLVTLSFVSLLAVACGETTRLKPLAPVQISKAEPPPECQPAGTVTGSGWSVEDAYSELRQGARNKKANYVVMDGLANGLFGRAFRCPVTVTPKAGPAPVTASEASTACEPACSPGYVCLRAACVSACNPPCATGQRCEADRSCHATP